MSQTQYAVNGEVAVITMDNPPVNGLGHQLRTGIAEGLRRAQLDPAVKAIVLTGSARAFSGGADIREFNTPKALAEPNLLTLIRLCERATKPVVAAVSGVAMGGGLELALGCHYRVAAPGAQIALPEVKLGLIPGAGGTQRLPRVVPLEMAVNMIVSGEPVKSEKFKGTKLFDEIVEGDLLEGALAFARKVVAESRGMPKVRDLKVEHEDAEAFLNFARNTAKAAAKNLPAPARAVEAMTSVLGGSFDEGMARERAVFLSLMATPESRALRHAFSAERAASKIPDVPEDTPTRKIALVAVIGAGTMGGGISMSLANAGIPVKLLEVKQEALDRGVAIIRKNYENTAKKGRITAEDVEKRMALIQPTLSYDDIASADLVIEAVFEDIGVKEGVFRKLDQVMKPGAILASNTSFLDLNRIAGFTKRPQDVVGLHFFSPANVMKLLEVVRGAATARDVLASVMQLAKKIRKIAVVSGVCDGFIGNRMLDYYLRESLYMVEEGATPQQVDRAIEKFGFAMGPFRMSDLTGHDVGHYIRSRRYTEKPDLPYPRVADRVFEMGRLGQKNGLGWYRYEPGRRDPLPDPAIDEMLVAYRKQIGVTPRKFSDEEIVERLMFALINEGARILEEGIAARASDIDMIYLSGYGFPLHRGGPMLYADEVGLYNVANRMQDFAALPHGDASFWKPAPLLAKLAAEGRGFNG